MKMSKVFQKCCVVPNCDAYNVPTYGFPRAPLERRKWAAAVGINVGQIGTFGRLCVKHFRRNDFTGSGQVLTLRDSAVPSNEINDEWFQKIFGGSDYIEEEPPPNKPKRSARLAKKKPVKMLKKPMKKYKEKVKLISKTKFYTSKKERAMPKLPEKIVETPDVRNAVVVDREYYYVLRNRYKHSPEIKKTSPEKTDVDSSTTAAKETSALSVSEILANAMIVASTSSAATTIDEVGKKTEGLNMPNCLNAECRQLAGRIFMLEKQKASLQKVHATLNEEVARLERICRSNFDGNDDGSMVKKPKVCTNCLNGRLGILYKQNLIRVNHLRQKSESLKSENIRLAVEFNADKSKGNAVLNDSSSSNNNSDSESGSETASSYQSE